MKSEKVDNIIVGAGVSGLSLSYYLRNSSKKNLIIEKSDLIGGNCKTLHDGEFSYDIGGHRFYTKSSDLQEDMRELLGDDFLSVGRRSSIYVNNTFIKYPLQLLDSLRAFSFPYIFVVIFGYLSSRLFKRKDQINTFEDWVSKNFGEPLYRTFFKGYSEKVWGISCSDLTADFAAERIRTLTLWKAVKDILFKYKSEASLIKSFSYPRFGFGMIPEKFSEKMKPEDRIFNNTTISKIIHNGNRVLSVELHNGENIKLENFVNTIDFESFITTFEPRPPENVIKAANDLLYRDIIIAHIKLDRKLLSKNLWIYFPGENEIVARLHEPKNWSKELAPIDKTSIVVEIFAFKGKGIWNKSESEILEIIYSELVDKLELFSRSEILGGKVSKVQKAYPIYTIDYKKNLNIVNKYLNQFSNFYNIGRSASFKYTSTDFYILMGKSLAKSLDKEIKFESSSVLLEGIYAEE